MAEMASSSGGTAVAASGKITCLLGECREGSVTASVNLQTRCSRFDDVNCTAASPAPLCASWVLIQAINTSPKVACRLALSPAAWHFARTRGGEQASSKNSQLVQDGRCARSIKSTLPRLCSVALLSSLASAGGPGQRRGESEPASLNAGQRYHSRRSLPIQ